MRVGDAAMQLNDNHPVADARGWLNGTQGMTDRSVSRGTTSKSRHHC